MSVRFHDLRHANPCAEGPVSEKMSLRNMSGKSSDVRRSSSIAHQAPHHRYHHVNALLVLEPLLPG